MKNLLDGLRAGSLLTCLILSFQVAAGQQGASGNPSARQLSPEDGVRLTLKGLRLSIEEAKKLEEKLTNNPQDLQTRFTLIGYYSTQHNESSRLEKRQQALWVIQNIPDSELQRHVVFVRLNRNDEGFEEARQLWLKQLDAYKGNLVVLSNAANFFLIPDKALAEQLLKQGVAADPRDAQWPQRLGDLYVLEMSNAAVEQRRSLAALAYAQFEQAYKLTKNDSSRGVLLIQLAKSAFEAGDVERAHKLADAVLSRASTDKENWNYGNSIHQGHLILGRIALLSGNLDEAGKQLIKAGETPGSPQLDSFGPNMTLAKELLEKGEREAVIKYFRLCANFWTNLEELKHWTAIVIERGIPDFGANLVY
jgi:tetratricopeptide (TPR) repeat protein